MSKKALSATAEPTSPERVPLPFDAVLLVCNEYAALTRQVAFLSQGAPKERIVGDDAWRCWNRGGMIFLQRTTNANQVSSGSYEIDRIQLNRSTLMNALFSKKREYDRKLDNNFSDIEIEKAKIEWMGAVDEMDAAEQRFKICKKAIDESTITLYTFVLETLQNFAEHGTFLAAEVKESRQPERPDPVFPTDFEDWMKSRTARKTRQQPAVLETQTEHELAAV